MSGLLFIVSAPSGTGKTTLVERLVRDMPGHRDVALVHVARAAPGEADGVDYNFISRAALRGDDRGRRSAGARGRVRQPLRHRRGRDASARSPGGDDLVLVIDVQGARKVRTHGLRARRRSSCCRRPSRCSRSGCGGAARTPRRRSSGGSRWRSRRSPPSRSTTTSSINDDVDSARRAAARDRRSGTLEAARDAAEGRRDHRELPRRAPPRVNAPERPGARRTMSLIALGVTGGIGAYKAVEVARGLQKRGHDVVAIMTRSARRFVGPLTFEAITRRRVITDQWSPGTQRRHRAHLDRHRHRPAARRAGDRQHHRQVRRTASPTISCRRCISRRARRC